MKFIFFKAQKTVEILHDFDKIYVKCILEKEILQNEHARAADPGRPRVKNTALYRVAMQIVLQKQDRLPVALEPEPHVRLHAGEPRVGDLPEVLALPDVGQMDLDRRNGDGFECV